MLEMSHDPRQETKENFKVCLKFKEFYAARFEFNLIFWGAFWGEIRGSPDNQSVCVTWCGLSVHHDWSLCQVVVKTSLPPHSHN